MQDVTRIDVTGFSFGELCEAREKICYELKYTSCLEYEKTQFLDKCRSIVEGEMSVRYRDNASTPPPIN